MLPNLLPLLGVVGFFYYALHLLEGSLRTSVVCLFSHFSLPKKESGDCALVAGGERKSAAEAIKSGAQNARKPLYRMLRTMVPIVILTFILSGWGVFDALASSMKGFAAHLPIPGEGLPIIAAYLGHSVAAYAVAGSLLEQGILGVRDTLLCLLVGSLLGMIVYLRSHIPYYLGIFGPNIGGQLLTLSLVLRSMVSLGVIAALIRLW